LIYQERHKAFPEGSGMRAIRRDKSTEVDLYRSERKITHSSDDEEFSPPLMVKGSNANHKDFHF
jgi:hypothetical protein